MIRTASPGEHPDHRWEPLKRRDKSAEGTFVYAVMTTGVYCRPSCPSRLPRPENVRFFGTNEDAEKAGFRPCKRCKPDAAPLETRQAEAISKACALIDEAEDTPDFEAIAKAVGMSRHHFHRVFKQITGVTPGAYLKSLRERRAVEELGRGSSVTEAIHGAGYSSSSRFYETLAPKLGMKPGAFGKGGANEVIRFAVGECSLGNVLVAATEKGLCAIEFGDMPEDLVKGLQDRFPKAEFIGGDADFEQVVAKVVGFVEEPKRGFDLPLHVRGTAFQQQIWQILREIPTGKTMTYAEVAARAGRPSAVRAVASACASNKLAVVIPCHRVVRTGGSLSGYRWGVERKAALLSREAGK
jgi:AraC family transcriptional regulator, regulatory protein of adaptative response / methylated-DNA-[protein]-cysteine methyltransferase